MFTEVPGPEQWPDLALLVSLYRLERRPGPAGSHKRPLSGGLALLAAALNSAGETEVEVRLMAGEEPGLLAAQLTRQSAKLASPAAGPATITFCARLQPDRRLLGPLQCETRRLGLPTVVMPGDLRNDLFVSLARGQDRGKSSFSGRNMEVRVGAWDRDGTELSGAVIQATGSRLVLPTQPAWEETFRLAVGVEQFPGTHIRLEFYNPAKERLVGLAWLEVMCADGTVIQDG